MGKVKIKLVSIGHLPLEFESKKIKNFSSSLFEVIGKIDNHELRCNSDGSGWEFSDDLVRKQMPDLNGADFMIAIGRCWDRHQFKKPGLPMLFAAYYGIVTLLAQIPHRFQLMASR